uniref:Uncharacterized protein n=1 Tax=Oryza glumipatula TaxID=40148 RepID=A0A0D9Z5K4_9ORYZ
MTSYKEEHLVAGAPCSNISVHYNSHKLREHITKQTSLNSCEEVQRIQVHCSECHQSERGPVSRLPMLDRQVTGQGPNFRRDPTRPLPRPPPVPVGAISAHTFAAESSIHHHAFPFQIPHLPHAPKPTNQNQPLCLLTTAA